MISLLDNISSLLVFASVAFVITSTQFRAQQSAVEQTIAYMSKKQTLEFADQMEREFKLIGAGRDESEDKIVSISNNADGMTESFSFWRADELGTDYLIGFALSLADSVYTDDGWVKRYKVSRTENGAAAGGSPSTLTDFKVELLTSAGGPATTSTAELVRINFVNMYPVGDPDQMAIRQTHWGITVRPLNLADDS